MALARSRRDARRRLLAGLRRRAVDAAPRHHLPAVVFVVVQFFLSQEITGKDTALSRLNAQIAQLTDLLALEKTGKVD